MNHKKSKDYLSNKEMFTELILCQERELVSDKLARMFMLLSKRYATKPNFVGYSYIDEAISLANVNCVAALHKFDKEKGENAFAYFTSVIHNSFLAVLKSEKNAQRVRDELLVSSGLNPSFGYQDSQSTTRSTDDY